MARRIRLLQVGLGFWGLDWAQEVLPHVPEVELVGHVDPDPAALARLGSLLGIPRERCFTSLTEALERTACDAVLASLPTAYHVPVAQAALEAGRHVIVEKPMTPTLKEAAALAALAEARGLVLMASQNYRFYPAAIAAAEIVAGGTLGRALGATIDFRRDAPVESYRYYDIPHPLLADMAIHHFDLLRMVLGRDAQEVSCCAWNPPGSPFRSEPCGTAAIRFEGDVVASWRGSWLSRAAPTAWGGEWVVELEGGAVLWTCRGSRNERKAAERIAVRRPDGRVEPLPMAPLAAWDRAGTLTAFARAILSGTTPPRFSSGRDNLGSLAMVEAAIRSAGQGGVPVRLAELLGEGESR